MPWGQHIQPDDKSLSIRDLGYACKLRFDRPRDHRERNHQGPANRIIEPSDEVGQTDGMIAGKERLGGLLRYYRRQAA